MSWTTRLLRLVSVLVLCAVVFMAKSVYAQTGLRAELTNKSPAQPTITLTNTSESPCQILDTAQGTTAIVKLMQSGKQLTPQVIDSATDEDIGYLLKNHFKTLQPGASASILLQSNKTAQGQVLRSTTWSADGGAYVTQYSVASAGDLAIEGTYTIPIMPASGARICAASVPIQVGDKPIWRIAMYVAGLLILVVLVLIIVVILRRRRKPKLGAKTTTTKAVLLFLVVGMTMSLVLPRQAHASVTVSPGLQSAFDTCMGTLRANRDITGPVLDALDAAGVHVEIVPTSGGSETTGYRAGSDENFTIYWNPTDTHAYAGTGGSADPCTSLYHEMYHVLDMHNGTFSRADCAGSGIETKEVMATRAQNILRERLGMPARSHYGDRALPSGSCSAPPAAPQCTGEHCADTNGDPHLLTFDGLRYDFQAAGEFVASRSKTNEFEMQVRQQPWDTSRTVSINTAAAFRVGKDRVELRAGQALALLVNGKTASLENTTLPGGGSIALNQGVVVLTWPDTSVAYIRSVGAYGIAVSIQLSNSTAGSLVGLLGDADGSADNDLRLQNSNKAIKPEFNQLYPSFADSWRITDKTSLFTYNKGKSTATYTDKSMPEKSTSAKTIAGYAAAERFCKSLGLTDPTIIANCSLDLAITGQTAFARAAVYGQFFASGASAKGTAWQLQNVIDGTPVSQTFQAKSGEKVFISVPKTNLPSQCGTLVLLAPDGSEVGNGCIINGKGYIDGTVLPQTGTYTIRLTPQGSGAVAIKLLRIADKTGTVAIDGAAVSVNIDQPGVVARYGFKGTAGQRIYTSIPTSTLGSQCGIVRIIGPDNHEVGNGCIINNVGNIDTVALPATGQYTFVLDSNDFVIGSATVRINSATVETKTLDVNGSTQSVNLKKPGSIAQFTFSGHAGQRIFVDLPTSDLPSQCGLLILRAPDETNLGSGCVINHRGNLTDDGTVLPAAGTYTITLDPNDDGTGTTSIRLRDR